MSKKLCIFFLCFTLVLISSVFPQRSIAADVETNGDLTVHGVVESSSGGFRFPDGSTLTTVGVTGTPLAHGTVGADGTWSKNSHSSNVSAVSHKNTGVYEITVSGQSMNFDGYTTVISMADTGPGFVKHIYSNGRLVVTTYNTSGNVASMAFTFIIMQK